MCQPTGQDNLPVYEVCQRHSGNKCSAQAIYNHSSRMSLLCRHRHFMLRYEIVLRHDDWLSQTRYHALAALFLSLAIPVQTCVMLRSAFGPQVSVLAGREKVER